MNPDFLSANSEMEESAWLELGLTQTDKLALRDLLKLPFEKVIVSHGYPIHTRSAFERALELPPWNSEE
jgi:hypothetical protein